MQICVCPLLFANNSASTADAFSLNTAMRFLRGESEKLDWAQMPKSFLPLYRIKMNVG